ncbi:MAG: UDP-N-acetylmuramoyl-L-alanyl-D-glutamate--2,6-diaminopimelate ligase [Ilumatobacteraceae bacterium]
MDRLLGALLADAALPAAVLRGTADPTSVPVTGVTHDSRRVRAGTLFCCIRGGSADGHDFAASAVAAGATALLVDHPLDLAVAQIVVPDTRWAMGRLAAAFWGHPSRSLTMVGVTGTNGKTTTSSLIAAVLEAAGMPTGVVGTLTGTHTTPESSELQERLAGFVTEGKRAVVMEVSSHALHYHRVVGCHFDVAVFTNLGRDHLDLHGTVERYFAAKALLFAPALSDRGVSNVDDVHGRLLVDTASVPMTPYSSADAADVEVGADMHAYTWRGERIRVALGGAFNVMNSLAAATAGALLDIPTGVIAQGLAAVTSVPGRFEAVRAGQPFDVIVDFAHTPDGLREALGAARAANPTGRVIAVFGCGGDRDREKRPDMGEVAASLADLVVVTSDNPRSEDPLAIINAIIGGVPADYRDRIMSEPDRRRAFATAFRSARPGDLVLIAGKGHETTQTIGSEVLPFDDRAVARALLEAAQ